MEKIRKILMLGLSAVALVSITLSPVANAALGELYMETDVAPVYAYTEDFDNDYAYFGDKTVYKHPNDYDSKISLVDAPGGLYSHYASEIQHIKVDDADGGNAIECSRFAIKVPGFFKDKPEGIYTVKFDIKLLAKSPESLYAQRLDVGKTAGGGAKYIQSEQSFSQYGFYVFSTDTTSKDWQTVTGTFIYKGSVSSSNGKCSDDDALVLIIGNSGAFNNPPSYQKFQIDNIKVSMSQKAELQTYLDKEVGVNTTVYNNTDSGLDAKLITVLYDDEDNINFTQTADVFVEANSKDVFTTKVVVPKTADNTWRICSYLWSADGQIEAYCDENILFNQLNTNSGLEVFDTNNETGLLSWDCAASEKQFELSTDSYGGVYSVKVPASSTDGLKQDISGILKKLGSGNYKLTAYVKSDSATKAKLGFVADLKEHSVTNDWTQLTYDFTVPVGTLGGTVSVVNSGSGSLYIDDVVITRIY